MAVDEGAREGAVSLDEDTAVRPDPQNDGGFVADVSRDWRLYGPLGGYLGALALRAASRISAQPHPCGASVQFVNPSASGRPLRLAPRIIRRSRAAECIGVEVSQEGRAILEAAFWFAPHDTDPDQADPHDTDPDQADAAEAYEQRRAMGADPRTLQPLDDVPGRRRWPWERVIQRIPVVPFEQFWRDGAEHPLLDPPVGQEWFRFRDQAQFADPVLEAARLLIVADAAPWLAIHFGRVPLARTHFPMTTSLSVQFARTSGLGEYLLARGVGAAIRRGAYVGTGTIWGEDGRLLATALQHNQLRRIPRRQ